MGMNGPTTVPPPALYVRALYDYETDDRTSLTFRQGDTIQVITQLSSGWWDGILDGVRGWFPSNYCVVVSGASDTDTPQLSSGETPGDSSAEEEYEEREDGKGVERRNVPTDDAELDVVASWIPQATPDGQVFYFNTVTGRSTMEIPRETPTSANEAGPRGPNVDIPEQTRPPLEVIAGGIRDEEEYDGESASEVEEAEGFKHNSYPSDGVSPAASQESFSQSPVAQSRGFDNQSISMNTVVTIPMGNAATSFNNPLGQPIPRSFFDDNSLPQMTWNKLVENIRRTIESYRQSINNADRSDYVRKGEDVSDNLRMLLAAASLTTDNHSGNPSIISTNRALYPHFRDMMSRFSKLVLSSHIAAADWPAPDAYSKCLQEAEGVLQGVYGYVEVARTQRGDDIPRLVPGFVVGSTNGGGWQNNGLGTKDPILTTSFMEDEYEAGPETTLDGLLLSRMDELKRMIVLNIRRLEEHLVLREKVVTPIRHKQIGNAVCQAAGKVVENFRPWISAVESINLAPLSSSFHHPQLVDFAAQKQRMYDLITQLVLACQGVAAPLADEWADGRGDPLEHRLGEVSAIARQLEACSSQISFALQQIRDIMPASDIDILKEIRNSQASPRHHSDGGASYESTTMSNIDRPLRPNLEEMNFPVTFSEGLEPPGIDNHRRQDMSKVKKFFGEVPRDIEQQSEPLFLRLDFEGEILYDNKTEPPQLRGGTLVALVEQLTRHDRLDYHFNTTFQLTYKSFTSAPELFEMLVKRFNVQPPRGITEDDYRTWVEKKQKPIRFRVANILKSWFDNYWMEDDNEASKDLLRKVFAFAKDSIATTATLGSGTLLASIDRRLKGQDPNAKGLVPTPSASMPTPIMPKNMKKLKFLDIDPTEFARQLTIIESRLYSRIKPSECLNKTWNRKGGPDDPDPAPTVRALILHANQLTNWVAEMILNQSEVKKRVYVIKHFVTVADVRHHPPTTSFKLTKTRNVVP